VVHCEYGSAVDSAIAFDGVTVWRAVRGGRKVILDRIDWAVGAGEHWGLLGPNGAGKTTLLRVASAQMRPSSGVATVLGGRLGRVPLADLRRRIGLVDPGDARRFYPEHTALDVVLTGASGTILLVDDLDRTTLDRALSLLDATGAADHAGQLFSSCSEGERARIMLARGLMADAPLLVLDEPAAGLDLPGRELLLRAFEQVTRERPHLTTLTVTHHVEELPPSVSHALLLRDGAVVTAGPIDEAVTDEAMSACFGLPLAVTRRDGRLSVRAASP
jgi:iron complex transport system ATP-binding protein